MSKIRPITDFPRNEQGYVAKFIGSAYDCVKYVADHMLQVKTCSDNMEDIKTVAAWIRDNQTNPPNPTPAP